MKRIRELLQLCERLDETIRASSLYKLVDQGPYSELSLAIARSMLCMKLQYYLPYMVNVWQAGHLFNADHSEFVSNAVKIISEYECGVWSSHPGIPIGLNYITQGASQPSSLFQLCKMIRSDTGEVITLEWAIRQLQTKITQTSLAHDLLEQRVFFIKTGDDKDTGRCRIGALKLELQPMSPAVKSNLKLKLQTMLPAVKSNLKLELQPMLPAVKSNLKLELQPMLSAVKSDSVDAACSNDFFQISGLGNISTMATAVQKSRGTKSVQITKDMKTNTAREQMISTTISRHNLECQITDRHLPSVNCWCCGAPEFDMLDWDSSPSSRNVTRPIEQLNIWSEQMDFESFLGKNDRDYRPHRDMVRPNLHITSPNVDIGSTNLNIDRSHMQFGGSPLDIGMPYATGMETERLHLNFCRSDLDMRMASLTPSRPHPDNASWSIVTDFGRQLLDTGNSYSNVRDSSLRTGGPDKEHVNTIREMSDRNKFKRKKRYSPSDRRRKAQRNFSAPIQTCNSLGGRCE